VLTGHGTNERNKFNKFNMPETIQPTIKEAVQYIAEKQ
jgi:hypothetical protein